MSTRNLQIPLNLINELGVLQIIDITDKLPTRKGGWNSLVAPRQLEALTDIVWHHSAMFLSEGCDAYSHARTHVNAGEGGCPYHFHLLNGQWYQTNDLLTFTYGVKSNNTYTVHVCVEGCYVPDRGYEADELSEENQRAMVALELTLRGIMPNYKASNGHNYYKPTLCPGYSMTRFREEVLTVDNRLKQESSWVAKRNKVNELANQYQFMFDLMVVGETNGDAQWAMNQLLETRQIMIERGLMKSTAPDDSE